MRYLLILDVAVAALGGAMTIGIGFVALIFLIYRRSSPDMAAQLPGVLVITACFLIVSVLGALASLLLRRHRPAHWALQLALFGALPLLWQIILNRIQN